jgi:hypothetical protein
VAPSGDRVSERAKGYLLTAHASFIKSPPATFIPTQVGSSGVSPGAASNCHKALLEWEALLVAELRALEFPEWHAFVAPLTFRTWPVVRLTYMMLQESGGFVPGSHLAGWLVDMFSRKGDSRLIENVFHDIRSVERHATNRLSCNNTVHMACITAPAMQRAFGASALPLDPAEVEGVTWADAGKWQKTQYRHRKGQMPEEFSGILLPKWSSPSLDTDNTTLMQWLWLQEWTRLRGIRRSCSRSGHIDQRAPTQRHMSISTFLGLVVL